MGERTERFHNTYWGFSFSSLDPGIYRRAAWEMAVLRDTIDLFSSLSFAKYSPGDLYGKQRWDDVADVCCYRANLHFPKISFWTYHTVSIPYCFHLDRIVHYWPLFWTMCIFIVYTPLVFLRIISSILFFWPNQRLVQDFINIGDKYPFNQLWSFGILTSALMLKLLLEGGCVSRGERVIK